ncbi:MAG: hypothetical protein QNJ12_08340 [Ilumatobacter sp.]|uniref:hypothetical protein n=1 Tax=Ilumatobacter sp. TaxID=1967498 RepID=UPI00262F5F0F|nr:hypothetical protein [Ilumatobacter sp.]MDJ0768788.1 hypothetical protein [Ilumatobacter sp.]
MRRSILTVVASAAAFTMVLPMSVQAGDADRRSDGVSDRRSGLEALRLECAVRTTDAGPAVRCEWSMPQAPAASWVRLVRLDPDTDRHRQVVFRTADLTETGYLDAEVRAGHRYVYAVQALSEAGRVVGQSRPERVRVTADVEVLRLRCRLGPAREAIGCEWSRPQSRDAFVVSLWRSVDGGPRELVERFRPSGPNAYRDPVPAGASKVTYAVIATTETDRIVARSRPETVRIPRPDAARDREVLAL